MKCHKPNTNQEVEFTVLANGVRCDEYVLPPTNNSDPDVLECFIPVSDGDQLTLTGSFTGSVLHGAFDLLADGSFLGDKRIEGPKSGDTKYHKKRKLDIKTVFDTPVPEGHTSIFAPDTIVEGNLHVRTLRSSYQGSPLNVDSRRLGVGSLTVICSLNQKTEENYVEKYPSATCGDWPTRGQDDVTDGGVGPTHEMEVKVTDEDVSKKRQQKHKRHIIQTHFGLKPWAKLIFHYRSKEAIEQAGCEERSVESQALQPADEETFIRASTETVKKGAAAGTRSSKTAVKEEEGITVASRASRGNSLFTSPPPSETSRMSPSYGQYRPTPTPAPEAPKKPLAHRLLSPSSDITESSPSLKKKKLFGQSLNLGSTQFSPMRQLSSIPAALVESETTLLGSRENESLDRLQHITPFSMFNKTLEKLPTTGFPQGRSDGSMLPLMSDDELADAISGAQDFLSDTPQGAAPVAPMMSQNEGITNGRAGEEANSVKKGQTQERPVRVKVEEPTSPSRDSFGDTQSAAQNLGSRHSGLQSVARVAKPTSSLEQLDGSMTSPPPSLEQSPPPSHSNEDSAPCKLTADDIRPHIPAEGIKLNDLKNFFDTDQLPSNKRAKTEFWALVRNVALNKRVLYYPRPVSQGSTQPPSPSQPMSFAESLHNAEVAEQQVADDKPTKIELESETSPHQVPSPTKSQQYLTPPASVSRKRLASSMAASRESTPSKKPRFSELSSKKAELLKSLEAKKQRKLEAQEALAEQRKLREEAERLREEAEMREIEMLQRMEAEEDEEIENLARLKEMEEAELEEANAAMEKAEGAVRAVRASEEL
ncbi:hypothetical protein LTR36_007904 [Oleoguttula mirabilis]|uniref:Uncharacterized protein n=1 Tax=Oleoguttula mirabilis TaxID=1507867 RepID=A0AAV9J930_9PEZI|nr:hypothetical protein LTR36_007904 [Oleoguttula mirabilis]